MSAFSCVFTLGFTCLLSSSNPVTASAPVVSASSLAFAAPAAAASDRPAWRPEKASSILTLVQAFYDATADMEARFKQTYWNPTFASRTVTTGDLRLKKPGMMVWDYSGKTEPDYYADGDKMWIVEHDTRQVVSAKVDGNSDLSAAMKFLFGGQTLVKEFKVRYTKDPKKIDKYGDSAHHVLDLKPRKKSPHYKGLLLSVHATTGRVDAFVVYNQDGSSNYFRLTNLKTNRGFTKSVFKFKVPTGYVESKE
jgi:outer membrane lipoprotein carrier protein